MSNEEKLEMLMSLLGVSDSKLEDTFNSYLTAAAREILAWRYSYSAQSVEAVPPEYEMTQIYAVLAGFTQSGAENQYSHTENGVSRTFKHADMIAYIRAHVIPFVKVM